jgi:type III restriction enzyme
LDGIRLHESTKAELAIYAKDNGIETVKPFVLVVAVDTSHAAQLKEQIQKDDFFGGYYKDKVMDIHSGQRGTEKDENIELLLNLEHPENKIEIVIHVNMLKEGWDVTNLYTIVPLRTSASRTLTEQTIGRGLRLPYGKHTGYDPVDTLTIVQHDKFQDIIDEANKPDSIIKIENIIQIDADEPATAKEIVTGVSYIAQQIVERKKSLESLAPEQRKKEEIKIEMDEFILPFINKIAPKVNSFSQESITAAEHIEEFKKTYTFKLEKEGNLFAASQVAEAVERYYIQAKTFVDNTIPIPRITIVPSGNIKLVFKNFDLKVNAINFQPGSEDIVSHELQSGAQKILVANQRRGAKINPEEQLILLLMDKPEIFYDDHHELLYHLTRQLISHLNSYLSSNDDIFNVINNYKKPITELIYQQMMDNHEIVSEGFEKTQIKGKPYSEIKEPSAAKYVGDRIYDYKENIEPAYLIKSKVFTGFLKAYHHIYKFDSKTEKDFSSILEKDSWCLKWLKPALGQFNIHYGRPAKNYTPDFIVETTDVILMVETKKKEDLEDKDVLSKAKAAILYCYNASEYNKTVGGKPWKYILIPHDQVKLNMSLAFLIKMFEVKTNKQE